jgi:hypothetical protein
MRILNKDVYLKSHDKIMTIELRAFSPYEMKLKNI